MAALVSQGAFIVTRFSVDTWIGAISCSAGYLRRVSFKGKDMWYRCA
jgi:hypothetical protein